MYHKTTKQISLSQEGCIKRFRDCSQEPLKEEAQWISCYYFYQRPYLKRVLYQRIRHDYSMPMSV